MFQVYLQCTQKQRGQENIKANLYVSLKKSTRISLCIHAFKHMGIYQYIKHKHI